MRKVIIVGATGSLGGVVVEQLAELGDVELTLFVRSKNRLRKAPANTRVVEADVMNFPVLKSAISGHDIVYVNLAGDLEAMSKNIVKVTETGVKRVIAISSIGIYEQPMKPVLRPYRALADVFEASGLDYTILRPDWFTNANEVDYAFTNKGEPEIGSAISRKSIASFISTIVENPGRYKKKQTWALVSLISKP